MTAMLPVMKTTAGSPALVLLWLFLLLNGHGVTAQLAVNQTISPGQLDGREVGDNVTNVTIATSSSSSSQGQAASTTTKINSGPISTTVRGIINGNGNEDGCNFVGKIVFGQPLSLTPGDRFYRMGKIMSSANKVTVHRINTNRCGIHLSTGNYALEVRNYDDHSSVDGTIAVANHILYEEGDVDVLLGGMSSTTTLKLAEIAQDHGRLLIAPAAAATPVYKDRDMVFGIIIPGKKFMKSSIQGLAKVGAKTVATMAEDGPGTRGLCAGVPDFAASLGMVITSHHDVIASPNLTVLEPVANHLANENPDVVVSCLYDCVPWVQAMRKINWSPKAQVFTICVGSKRFEDELGTDIEYMMGANSWDASVNSMDPITGWSAREYAEQFVLESSFEREPYQSAYFTSVITMAVQAIEATDSTNDQILAEHIRSHTYNTTFGQLSFDENGQGENPALLVQYSPNQELQIVYPDAVRSASILYPMPTWDQRDCFHLSPCGLQSDGICNPEGRCICSDLDDVSAGWGKTATCIKSETMNYIATKLQVIGYVLFVIVVLACLVAAGWTLVHRNTWIVKASQPSLLGLIIIGCFTSSLAIVFMGNETAYREIRDIVTWEFTEEINPDIPSVDASCMAVPWLYGIGFAISFAALFVKIERVRLISQAKKIQREKKDRIGLRHVAHIMALMLLVETVILTFWQILSPWQWEREVLDEENGFAVESVGRCSSDHGGKFLFSLMSFHIVALFYALILCFQTRYIHSDFAESREIATAVAFLFQVMVLVVPISILVEESNDIYYFVQVCAVFLQNFTVLALMFVPKVLKDARNEGDAARKRETIPLAALTNSKWDEGVDLINNLLEEGCDTFKAMSDEQRVALEDVKTLLLNGNKKPGSKEEKLSYIPLKLLAKATKSNRFIMNEFGGVTDFDDRSVMTASSLGGSSLGHDSDVGKLPLLDIVCPPSERMQSSSLPVPIEFQTLPLASKKLLCKMLSLSSLESWDFNIFKFMQATGGNPLLFMGWAILGSPQAQQDMAESIGEKASSVDTSKGYNFTHKRNGLYIPMQKLCDYLRVIEADYVSDNAYHNATHAADVLQTLHALIQMSQKGDSSKLTYSPEDLLAILLAAAIHDVKHPGRNNAFQEKAHTGYALTHNGNAILENMHVSHAFMRMLDVDPFLDGSVPNTKRKKSSLNIFSKLKKKQYEYIREKMIDAVLHTDMSRHFQFVTTMRGIAMTMTTEEEDKAVKEETNHLPDKDQHTWQIMLYMLHMADISGQAKPHNVALKWTDRCMEEFFAQGDHETELGMTISPLCDRRTVKVADSQCGFINFVVKPAFAVLGQLLPQVNDRVLPLIDSNLEYYTTLQSKDPPPETASAAVSASSVETTSSSGDHESSHKVDDDELTV